MFGLLKIALKTKKKGSLKDSQLCCYASQGNDRL